MTSTTTTVRKSYGSRKISTCADDYYRLVKPKSAVNAAPKKSGEDVAKLLKYIDDNIIGKNNAFVGPFGRRRVVFCDYGSSGRSLQFIEEYITREVLPCYGNTHTTTNITSLQSNLFRQEARELIKNAVNASADEDAVIFVGHGCTGAIKKLVNALDLQHEPPVVFVGASEHQDNLHIWQEIGAKIIRIAETKQNFLDLNDLEEQLKRYKNSGRQLIGCFAATSSVTGILVDDIAATMMLHQYGALAFWDFNLAAPYVTLNMNPNVPGVEDTSLASKDAIYFSGHKFVGGVQTPGILVAKKSLFKRVSSFESDGFFALHEQNKSFELIEEGTSAAVIESIRAGLVMQLKEAVTVNSISIRQEKITKQILQHIRTIPEVILLGNSSTGIKRIPVFSFMVRHPRGSFLHHNFVCAVLNDVFGIQARGGCPCSGAYAQELLGIDKTLANQYENIILEDRRLSSLNLSVENSHLELLRPGFTRISLPYFISDSELAFIMEAVKMVATEGWKLLPQYTVDVESGEWRHHTNPISRDRKWLSSIRYVDGKMTMNERRISGPGLFPQSYSECLQTARNLFNRARKMAMRNSIKDQGINFEPRAERLRWFMLQHEAQDILTGNSQNIKHAVPFNPLGFVGSKKIDHEGVSINHPVSNTSSPRHFSLPAIDDHKVLTCSSPVPYFVQDMSTYFPATSHHYYPATSYATQPVNFAVGEQVTTQVLTNPTIPNMIFRERCYSLGAPATVQAPSQSTILSPQTQLSLGMRQRHCSCSSNNEFQSLESADANSPTHSINMLSNLSLGRASPSDFGTMMTEMTREIATNIKSELREVINKVEDALDNTDATFSKHGSGSEDGRSDSISAVEVAEYLEKFSKEMANDVKTEIRDIVSSVDTYVTPDKRSFSRGSSSGDSDKCANNNYTIEPKYTPGSSSETVKQMINKSRSSDRLCDEETVVLRKAQTENVNKLSSQDSGINMSFSDMDFDLARIKSFQPAYNSFEEPSLGLKQKEVNKWVCPPKNIWQNTVEAVQEYEMVRNGDRVLVCLSGGKDSLTLLHTLLQYQSIVLNKGIVFTVGAIIVDPVHSGCDPCVLLPHLKSLGVRYVVVDEDTDNNEEKNAVEEENFCTFACHDLRQRLYASAKGGGYNVLAVGQHLDDFVESFLLSVFHGAKLKTLKPHYFIKQHDLRVIRPLAYVREKVLRHFASLHFGPLLNSSPPSSLEISKQRHRIRQLLAQHEIIFPKLFANLRVAIHPLIASRQDDSKSRRRVKSKSETELEPLETDEEAVFD